MATAEIPNTPALTARCGIGSGSPGICVSSMSRQDLQLGESICPSTQTAACGSASGNRQEIIPAKIGTATSEDATAATSNIISRATVVLAPAPIVVPLAVETAAKAEEPKETFSLKQMAKGMIGFLKKEVKELITDPIEQLKEGFKSFIENAKELGHLILTAIKSIPSFIFETIERVSKSISETIKSLLGTPASKVSEPEPSKNIEPGWFSRLFLGLSSAPTENNQVRNLSGRSSSIDLLDLYIEEKPKSFFEGFLDALKKVTEALLAKEEEQEKKKKEDECQRKKEELEKANLEHLKKAEFLRPDLDLDEPQDEIIITNVFSAAHSVDELIAKAIRKKENERSSA